MADAELAKARKQAEQMVVTAQADSEQRILAGRGEAQKIMHVGLSEAAVLLRKIGSFGDPRLYALGVMAEHLAHSAQPLVPERLFVAGGDGASAGGAGQGLLGNLISLLVAEKSGFRLTENGETTALKEYAERMTRQVMEALDEHSVNKPRVNPEGPCTAQPRVAKTHSG
jgi:hypothetical protein